MGKNWPSRVPLFCKCIFLSSANISVFIYFHPESVEAEEAWAEYKCRCISGRALFLVEANHSPSSLRAGWNPQRWLVSVLSRERRYESVISRWTSHSGNAPFIHHRSICRVAAASWPQTPPSYVDRGISSTWVSSDGLILMATDDQNEQRCHLKESAGSRCHPGK